MTDRFESVVGGGRGRPAQSWTAAADRELMAALADWDFHRALALFDDATPAARLARRDAFEHALRERAFHAWMGDIESVLEAADLHAASCQHVVCFDSALHVVPEGRGIEAETACGQTCPAVLAVARGGWTARADERCRACASAAAELELAELTEAPEHQGFHPDFWQTWHIACGGKTRIALLEATRHLDAEKLYDDVVADAGQTMGFAVAHELLTRRADIRHLLRSEDRTAIARMLKVRGRDWDTAFEDGDVVAVASCLLPAALVPGERSAFDRRDNQMRAARLAAEQARALSK